MVAKGSIVKLEFEKWVDGTDLIETTNRDVAWRAQRYLGDFHEGPWSVIVGVGKELPGVDEALLAAEVGKEVEVTIPAEKAFGLRDPEKVERASLREFEREYISIYPGLRIQYQGRTGTVVKVDPARRIHLDFNHPHAGKTLRYKFTILQEITDPVEKVAAIIDVNHGQGRSEGFKIEVRDQNVHLGMPEWLYYDIVKWPRTKYAIIADLRTHAAARDIFLTESHILAEQPPTREPDGWPAPP